VATAVILASNLQLPPERPAPGIRIGRADKLKHGWHGRRQATVGLVAHDALIIEPLILEYSQHEGVIYGSKRGHAEAAIPDTQRAGEHPAAAPITVPVGARCAA